MEFVRIEEQMNLGISDVNMIRSSPHTRSSSPHAAALLEASLTSPKKGPLNAGQKWPAKEMTI
jgi:hypothetical protein